jgi:hypothetical protein
MSGKVFSNNLIPKDEDGDDFLEAYESVPTIDDILDKINQVGIENLTKKERDILKGSS